MGENAGERKSIIGSGEMGGAVSIGLDKGLDKNAIHKTNRQFWAATGSEALGTTALPYYGVFASEENHHLFRDVAGKRVLEIGCGHGHSLLYMGRRKAAELWGVDISEEQLEKTRQLLMQNKLPAKLVCAPMEEECGIPTGYFDVVYSIYAIGWTTDLETTFARIASYLKKGGVFVFSWSHPIHKCVAAEQDALVFKKCYYDESWYSVPIDGGTLSLSDRKLSTYINALAKAGFAIEQMVEDSDDELLRVQDDEFSRKARMLPVTFVIKARKL